MQHNNKIAFKDIESGTMQDITRKFIDNHIIYNQSYLVSELMSKEIILPNCISSLLFSKRLVKN